MSTSVFRAEDWVYVADSMGRLGQGYYKNRYNQNQTITVSEFENRRAQPQTAQPTQKEQNINNISVSSPDTSQMPSGADSQSSQLTPWDNPVMGEQAVEPAVSEQEEEADTSVTPAQTTANSSSAAPVQQVPAKKKQQTSGESSGQSQGLGNADDNQGGSQGASAKVVCTELVRQGKMSEKDQRACTLYAFSRLPASFMAGYHFWAVPYVRLMRRSNWATKLIWPIVRSRTGEIRYRLGLEKKGTFFGKVICAFHDYACTWMGKFVPPLDYKSLYTTEEVKV